MTGKIDWYREVLEIEPNSKIFFPLARMLADTGQLDEAASVMREGVNRHPDLVEARLFFIELLVKTSSADHAREQAAVLGALFKKYPAFWSVWGDTLFADKSSCDAGLAAIFLGAFLQGSPISWANVIKNGLEGFAGQIAMTDREVGGSLSSSVLPDRIEPQSEANSSALSLDAVLHHEEAETDQDEVEEVISLRTRSMAEILAEQGDLAGALDIYNELFQAAGSAEKSDIQARIDVLSGKASNLASPAESVAAPQENKKNLLAMLAQRLESRALH